MTFAESRQKYRVPKGCQVVTVIKSCQRCTNLFAKPLPPAALPECRVKVGYAFETVGVDFAGPFYCSNGKNTIKAYITLFTCATTRAVHMPSGQGNLRTVKKQFLRI